MTAYQFTYYGDDPDDNEDFTVDVDDQGQVMKSTYDGVREGEDINRVISRYAQFHYEAGMVRETKKSAEQFVDGQWGEVGELAKFDLDKRLVFGWAYVTHDKDGQVVVDKSGEFIDDTDVLEEAAYDFVIKSRVAGDSHQRDLTADTAIQVGTMVESMVFTPEKVAKMGLPKGVLPSGWWVGFRIDNDDVWKDVKSGKRPAFSIHGKARKVEVTS